MPGIVNAAVVQLIVMCIYAILAVDLYGDFGSQGTYTNIFNESVVLYTARGTTYGQEYYGTFFRSLYTLFQVLTGESWSEAIARHPIFEGGGQPGGVGKSIVAAIYFVSYVIICGIVLVNVAVAVLLEKMVEPPVLPEIDGILLSEMPEHVQALLKPLDISNDGIISTDEMEFAAKALKRAQDTDAPLATREVLERLVETCEQTCVKSVSACVHKELERTQLDINKLREEAQARETRLLEALDRAAQREAKLQESLAALSSSLATLTSHASRARRNSKTNGGVSEDGVQDGERTPPKQAPDRLSGFFQSLSGTAQRL